MISLHQTKQSTFGVRALVTLLFALSLSLPLVANLAEVGRATIIWDANPEPDVIGYRVHYGSKSGTYTQVIDVGPLTSFVISGLSENQSYFCSVTAYNTYDMDSDFAQELVISGFFPPIVEELFRITRMTFGADHLVTFEVSGMIGNVVEVWASPNLVNWTLIESLINVSGPIAIEDPTAQGQPRRFYQLRTP